MPVIFTKAKLQIMAYRMAIVKFAFFTVVSLCSAIIGALTNVSWEALSGQERFLLILTVVVSWGTTMMAFFTSAEKKIESQLDSSTDTIQITKTTETTPK